MTWYRLTIDGNPNVVARRRIIPIVVYYTDYGEVRLVVGIDPVKEKPDNIIRAYPRSAGICDELNQQAPFFIRIRLVPLSKRLPNQRQVILGRDFLFDLLSEPLKPANHLPKGLTEILKFLVMLLEPFPKKGISLGIRFASFVRRGSRNHAANPRDAPKSGQSNCLENTLPSRRRGTLDLGFDRLYE